MLLEKSKIIYAASVLRAIQAFEGGRGEQFKIQDQDELYELNELRRQCMDPDKAPTAFETGGPMLIREDHFEDFLVEHVRREFIEPTILDSTPARYIDVNRKEVMDDFGHQYREVFYGNTKYMIMELRTRHHRAFLLALGRFEDRQNRETI
jgi:hypothetical protein